MKTAYEYVGNVHMHTPYSDGQASHAEIAQAALRAGLDFVIVTDHNVRVSGVEGYYYGKTRDERVLLLTGEEIHDTRRDPQANHLLVFGVEGEMAGYASNPQGLINEIKDRGGVAYLAHPVDPAAPLFGEDALPWLDWDVDGYTGIELWNTMSEFKASLTSKRAALRGALDPAQVISGPFRETLALWDKLLTEKRRIKIIGGADAHGNRYSMGPLTRTVFPYEVLFRCVNTHVLTNLAMKGDFEHDKLMILNALRFGTSFVGYDWPASTRGFQFTAQGLKSEAIMGEMLRVGHGVTLQVASPHVADLRLLWNGEIILRETETTHRTYIANQPGVYRVEAYIPFKGKQRGWIFSNPIFVTE
jgi:PHP domain